jgi:Flp pilus assembly pilin Flp
MNRLNLIYRKAKKKGQSIVEYALILGVISLACVALAQNMGITLVDVFGKISATCDETALKMPGAPSS